MRRHIIRQGKALWNSQGVKNIFFSYENLPQNPLVHIFLYITLAFGICFAFLADPSGASSTFLYQLTLANVDGWTASLWGIACILVTIMNTLAYIFRRKWFGRLTCYFGFAIWGFSFWVYALGGFWFGMMVASLPNLMFWAWEFIQVGKYHRQFEGGLYPRPKSDRIDAQDNS